MVHLTPGDSASIVAGENASLQLIEEARERFGLNASLRCSSGAGSWPRCMVISGMSSTSRGLVVDVIPDGCRSPCH